LYIYEVTPRDLEDAAEQVGVKVDYDWDSDRSRFKVRLTRDGDNYVKRNPISGHKAGVCFHGHYDFMEVLFLIGIPIIETSWYGKIKYRDYDDFLVKAKELGDRPLGPPENIYHQFRVRDQCNCEAEGWGPIGNKEKD
jgi:hypothetical protein